MERSSLCAVDPLVELELERELDDEDTEPATAIPDPTPTKATMLEAATILRARRAGWRRGRRRPAGVAGVSGMCTSCAAFEFVVAQSEDGG